MTPEDVEGARARVSVMYDDERLKFVVIVCGEPLDIPIGFMRISECDPLASILAHCMAAYAAPETGDALEPEKWKVTQQEIEEMRTNNRPPEFDWDKVHALLEPWREVWAADNKKYLEQHPKWMVEAAAELFAHDMCDAWSWHDYVKAAAVIIDRHYKARPSQPIEGLEQFEREMTALWWTAEMKPADVMRLLLEHLARHFSGGGAGPRCPKCKSPMSTMMRRISENSQSGVKLLCEGPELSYHEFRIFSLADFRQFFPVEAPKAPAPVELDTVADQLAEVPRAPEAMSASSPTDSKESE